jgi:AcrR family transcriptional regulator
MGNVARKADATVRIALLESAARLIATEGLASLTLRRVADEAGTSTMAVYTHFGGMPELRRAVRLEGFARLARRLAALTATDDPVVDVTSQGWAYYQHAVENPHLYRVMFLEHAIDDEDAAVAWSTFGSLVEGVRRCIDAGRFAPADPDLLARQLWAVTHGVVSVQLIEMVTADDALRTLLGAARNLYVGFGDRAERADASLARVLGGAVGIATA